MEAAIVNSSLSCLDEVGGLPAVAGGMEAAIVGLGNVLSCSSMRQDLSALDSWKVEQQ